MFTDPPRVSRLRPLRPRGWSVCRPWQRGGRLQCDVMRRRRGLFRPDQRRPDASAAAAAAAGGSASTCLRGGLLKGVADGMTMMMMGGLPCTVELRVMSLYIRPAACGARPVSVSAPPRLTAPHRTAPQRTVRHTHIYTSCTCTCTCTCTSVPDDT